ncbi:MAG: CTB family bacteriocin [Brasilonema octagenarum HA4186-MV1]|jgi:hypothetical protein|uniref:Uncharacterized protein n=2 Tax=Brasilonema TaxID=383614 RepID=A0A856MBP7_9CYAN|nr:MULTISPECIES: CTB family bacteriocin [Brasilonema]MBW4627908.1 CTB family bacteriocin [Brasilonema octagenarum HA4186-MV1]NMF62894.1 hypothetical protein [Brasilonema octagenarum UFV-OR1]QDL08695.1 hypothetical protein DP114_13065 [Brasilonema sennae CENA114]QDL15051.1 hypothetical protein DP113_13005 [Brasilonema octagenarum UFV-E1]
MSNDITSKNCELLTELSEQEQEVVSGGRSRSSFELRDFFFQRTNVRSFANSGFNALQSGASLSDQSGYMYSQTTLAIGSLFMGSGRSRRSRGLSGNNFLSFLLYTLLHS